jgi:hypothetical protein
MPEPPNRQTSDSDNLGQAVWRSAGDRSWCQDTHTGENTTLCPGSVIGYIRTMRSVSPPSTTSSRCSQLASSPINSPARQRTRL